MKLDSLFCVKENKLYKIADNSLVDAASLKKIEVKWSTVEIEEEAYNEEFLAALRDQLKAMDEAGTFAVIVPVVDKPLESEEQKELFINAFNHTARRIKDCISVAGMELPSELEKLGKASVEEFIEVLGKKHAQYVYFTKTNELGDASLVLY